GTTATSPPAPPRRQNPAPPRPRIALKETNERRRTPGAGLPVAAELAAAGAAGSHRPQPGAPAVGDGAIAPSRGAAQPRADDARQEPRRTRGDRLRELPVDRAQLPRARPALVCVARTPETPDPRRGRRRLRRPRR